MNHTRFAAEALRFRQNMVRRPMTGVGDAELEAMAAHTVAAGDPCVDGAIRRIATAWVQVGIPAELMTQLWLDDRIAELFAVQPRLVDALDDIVRFATRSIAA